MWKIWVEQGEVRPDQRPDTNATCLMELSDHMVLFDVPGPDAFVQAVIAKAKELRPNKPIPSSSCRTSIRAIRPASAQASRTGWS